MNRWLTAGTTADIVTSLIPNVRLRRRQFGSHFLRRFFAIIDAAICAIGRWLVQPPGTRIAVVTLMSIHAGLLAYSATRHSPTQLEPAFLASGISHWYFGRFELYRVNPPFPRMISALPVIAWGSKADWSRYYSGPGSRAEFAVGEDFLAANGPLSIPLFIIARWACIPFSVVGGIAAFFWASDLYGKKAGLLSLTLWVIEPNLLAHAELTTPDCACWSLGLLAGYMFWKWLNRTTWATACLAGITLGVAELTKFSWLILFPLWPLLWMVWRSMRGQTRAHPHSPPTSLAFDQRDSTSAHLRADSTSTPELRNTTRSLPSLIQLCTILALAIYVINLGYAFDAVGIRLRNYEFVSTTLTAHPQPGAPGNRFRGTWLGNLPVPLPQQYVLGIDSQNRDLQEFRHESYLRGEWKHGGWWYYYLYGLLVKVPCGLWALFAIVTLCRLLRATRIVPLRDEIVLLAPALILLAIVSSQTEFNIHLRYVFPTLAAAIVFLGQATAIIPVARVALGNLIVGSLVAYTYLSVLLFFPNHLAYFNDFIGGPRNGSEHLLGSSVDWRQGTLDVLDWLEERKLTDQVTFSRWNARNVARLLLDDSTLRGQKPARHLFVYDAAQFVRATDAGEPLVLLQAFPSGSVLVRRRD